MSNRSERRDAERQSRKLAYQQLRQKRNSESMNSQILEDSLGSLKSVHVNLSTGPRTEEGKEISSRNALKHGACSTATLILACESLDDFLALEKRWFKGYGMTAKQSPTGSPETVDPASPETEYEAELIRTAARADWFFLRADRNYSEVEAQMMNEAPNLLMWGPDHHDTLQRFLRYRTAHANSVAKHRKAIDDYRKNRVGEMAQMQKLRHHNDELLMRKERHEIFKEKSKPEPTWEEEIENMTQQAIRMSFRQPDPQPEAETEPAK